MSAHAKLSPSSAHRWLNCPASVKASEGVEDTGSEYATEGTAAHAVAEEALRNQVDPFEYQGYWFAFGKLWPEGADITDGVVTVDRDVIDPIDGCEITESMCAFVQDYVNYVNEFDGHLFVETRVDISQYANGAFGTVDALLIDDRRQEIHVIDLKFGRGVEVSAKGNEQLRLYALGAVEHLNFLGFLKDSEANSWTVTTHIIQPRLFRTSTETLKLTELTRWGVDVVAPGAKATFSKNPCYNPGPKQCQWCPIKGKCKALAEYSLKQAGDEFMETKKHTPGTLSNDDFKRLHGLIPMIRKWADAVEAELTDKLMNGETIDGLKVVAGRSIRKWGDVEQAEQFLKSLSKLKAGDIYTKKLITGPQAEKVINKNYENPTKQLAKFDELIVKPPGKPTVVKDNDKRESIANPSAVEEFETLEKVK